MTQAQEQEFRRFLKGEDGAFGNVHANETRAQVESSFVEGGVRACNIQMFIDRQNNFKSLPPSGTCGCRLDGVR